MEMIDNNTLLILILLLFVLFLYIVNIFKRDIRIIEKVLDKLIKYNKKRKEQ